MITTRDGQGVARQIWNQFWNQTAPKEQIGHSGHPEALDLNQWAKVSVEPRVTGKLREERPRRRDVGENRLREDP